jgi:hypothetical protein
MSTDISRTLLRSLPFAIALLGVADAGEPKTVTGLKNPESAAVGPDGKVYVTVIGEREKKGDGSVAIVESSGKITTFATGLDDPHGVVIVADSLYIADVKVVWKIPRSLRKSAADSGAPTAWRRVRTVGVSLATGRTASSTSSSRPTNRPGSCPTSSSRRRTSRSCRTARPCSCRT